MLNTEGTGRSLIGFIVGVSECGLRSVMNVFSIDGKLADYSALHI